jgi:hypothetical protein
MRNIQKKVKVKRAVPGMGLGLFAAEPIKKNEFIIEYTGERISNDEADRRQHTKYLFEIDTKHTIDGSTRSNVARYMNHFCKPNVEAETDTGRIYFHAVRNIQEGEELGYDYGKEYVDEFIRPRGCKCPAHHRRKK